MKKATALLLLLNIFFVQAFSQDGRIPAKGYAKFSKEGPFQPYEFTRHAVGDGDILIEVLYSGICHSDIHTVKGEWGDMKYPLVPGHEIAGRVVRVGKGVKKFKPGDYAGVGCMVNACGQCEFCTRGEEQYCTNGLVLTYASFDKFHEGEWTQGGYASNLVVSEKFALQIPKNADLKRVAPLLCAGITTYSPIKSQQLKKGDKVAVAGFGGLGHLAVQYAVKLGASVTVFDITDDKRQAALDMGAANYVNVNRPDELKGLDNQYRFILSTIPAKYDVAMYMRMLKLDGELVIVGLPAMDNQSFVSVGQFVMAGRRKVSGSMIGGIRETQEMLNYSVAHNIYPQVEMIPIQQLDEAYRKVLAGQVRFRYVIDMSSLK